jgi:hypothetical protein
MTRIMPSLVAILVLTPPAAAHAAEASGLQTKPNALLVLSDDQGSTRPAGRCAVSAT